jgi:hypothetical protein
VNELTDAQLTELLAQAKLRRFERDEVIYHLGVTCARMLRRNPRILYRAFEMFEARVDKLTQTTGSPTRTRSRSRTRRRSSRRRGLDACDGEQRREIHG